MMTFHEHITM